MTLVKTVNRERLVHTRATHEYAFDASARRYFVTLAASYEVVERRCVLYEDAVVGKWFLESKFGSRRRLIMVVSKDTLVQSQYSSWTSLLKSVAGLAGLKMSCARCLAPR